MSEELDQLTTYWAGCTISAIEAVDDEDVVAYAAFVGHDVDAIGSSEAFGDNDADRLEWIIGYLAYPTDAVYVTAVMPVFAHEGAEVVEETTKEDALARPDARWAVLVWSHCVATRESKSALLARFVHDNGQIQWAEVNETSDLDKEILSKFEAACHEFDADSDPDESHSRERARQIVDDENGNGYQSQFMEPGTIMAMIGRTSI